MPVAWRSRLAALALALAWLGVAPAAQGEPELVTGTIILGVPRADFVVLGADRLWINALAKPGDPPWHRRGREEKIVRHRVLPLAVAVAGAGALGPGPSTVEVVRELIAPLDASQLRFDTLVALLRGHLHPRVRAVRTQARRLLAINPADAGAQTRLRVARQTLFVAFVAGGRATLGWIHLDDTWKAHRESPPRGAVAWPDELDRFYRRGAFAGASALFGYGIADRMTLARHVRRVIQAGIREDARRNDGANAWIGGPVDVVLVDARGARCVPSCPPARPAGASHR